MLRIVLERQRKGLSQAKLSRLADVNAASMNRIEKGKEPPYPYRGQRIADALGWTRDYKELFKEVTDDE